jgi:peptidoglycan/LPS O-acetylase OafA/YrhL
MVFFFISGFVLPLRMLKHPESNLELFRKMLKRYLRMMIPLLVSVSLVYIAVLHNNHKETQSYDYFENVSKKSFIDVVYDGTFHTYFGINSDYAGVTWTIAVEFWYSMFVYLLAKALIRWK